MPRFVSFKCPVSCKHKDKNPFDSAELVGGEGSSWTVRCECGYVGERAAAETLKRSNRYPQFNGTLGTVVESRAHEDHVAKKMGMIPVDHVRVKTPMVSKNPHKRR